MVDLHISTSNHCQDLFITWYTRCTTLAKQENAHHYIRPSLGWYLAPSLWICTLIPMVGGQVPAQNMSLNGRWLVECTHQIHLTMHSGSTYRGWYRAGVQWRTHYFGHLRVLILVRISGPNEGVRKRSFTWYRLVVVGACGVIPYRHVQPTQVPVMT